MPSKYNLSETEYMIMQYLWQINRPITTVEIMQHFAELGYVWATQTVQTFLTRLIKKKALQRSANKKYCYQPTMSKALYSTMYLKETIQDNFGGSMDDFIVAFHGIKSELTEEQKEELRNLLNE